MHALKSILIVKGTPIDVITLAVNMSAKTPLQENKHSFKNCFGMVTHLRNSSTSSFCSEGLFPELRTPNPKHSSPITCNPKSCSYVML